MEYTNQTDLFSLQDKVALITGGSGDIGRSLARALASAGASIALNGTSAEKLDESARTLEAQVPDAYVQFFCADVSNVDATRQLARGVLDAFGRIDILVNCAGINRRKLILDMNIEDYEAVMGINLRGAFFTSQAVAPAMIEQGGGKIVNIGSLAIRLGLSEISPYAVSKAGLDELTRVMAVEWAQYNIQVNCLAPGFLITNLTRNGLWANESRAKWVLDRTPMRRPGEPDELAGAVLLLASKASSFITGQTIFVDGGVLAGTPW
jgi:NAD(P)-dependent dehydrogenase (short-subunit alcohol dehydrogenase family)